MSFRQRISLLFVSMSLIPMSLVAWLELQSLHDVVRSLASMTMSDEATRTAAFDTIAHVAIVRNGVIAVIFAVVVLFVARRLANYVTRPIVALAHTADQLTLGNTDITLPPPRGSGEIAQLNRSFGKMVVTLRLHDTLMRNLDLARDVQQSLLPSSAVRSEHHQMAGHVVFCEAAGGDYYDIVTLGGRRLLVIADVSGHGVAASLIMMALSGHLRALVRHHGEALDLPSLLAQLNQYLAQYVARDGHFVTMALVQLLDDGRWQWAWAGHPPALVYRSKHRRIETVGTGGIALGVMPHAVFPVQTLEPLERDDVLLLLTDGITEAHNETGVMFGTQGVRRCLMRHHTKDAETIAKAVIENARRFTGQKNPQDDMTALVMKAT